MDMENSTTLSAQTTLYPTEKSKFRDRCAIAAMQTMLAKYYSDFSGIDKSEIDQITKDAYRVADRMVIESKSFHY